MIISPMDISKLKEYRQNFFVIYGKYTFVDSC